MYYKHGHCIPQKTGKNVYVDAALKKKKSVSSSSSSSSSPPTIQPHNNKTNHMLKCYHSYIIDVK